MFPQNAGLWRAAALGLALVVAGILACMVRRLGTYLVVSDPPFAADVTLVTYGVNSFARPGARTSALRAAAARYKGGEAHAVVLSELADSDAAFRTPVALAQAALVKAGVPERDVVLLPAVQSEREEALALHVELERRGWTRVVAYAPDFRSRRTRGALRRAGADVRVISVPDSSLDLDQWWQTSDSAHAVLNEYPRLLYYLARGWT